MDKNIFDIFKEMNDADAKDGTDTLGLSGAFVAADKVKAGCHIKMGAPESVLYKLMNEESFCVLLIIDKKSYKEKGGK